MCYRQLLEELESLADENYRNFHKRLLKNENVNVLGVKIPVLRKIAKRYKNCVDELLTYPDEYYEVTFIKLTAVCDLGYESFINHLDGCVTLIDNWATCDCFTPRCIKNHKENFLPFIEKYSLGDGEFTQRFALTTLLHFYVEERYFDFIIKTVLACDTSKYYVHMAAAWLIAEMLVKNYSFTEDFLRRNLLDKKTHNKAIQKACESFRLSDEQKKYLKEIKR